MYLEELQTKNKEDRKSYLDSLTDEAKATLYGEIKMNRQKSQEEKIKAETQLDNVNKSLEELYTTIKEEGIEAESNDDILTALNKAIDELNTTINNAVLEYVDKIGE